MARGFKPTERCLEIARRYAAGETGPSLAAEYGMSADAVRQCAYRHCSQEELPRKGRPRNRGRVIQHQVTETGCWICTSHGCNSRGYPQIGRYQGRMVTTIARYLFEQAYGELPHLTMLRHTCGEKRCINLEHIQPLGVHRCPGCKLWLRPDAFYPEPGRPHGLSAYCRECKKARLRTYNQRYYQEHREEIIATTLRRRKSDTS